MLPWISRGAWKLGKWHPHFLANVDCNPQDGNKENWMPFSGLLKLKGVASLLWWSFPGQNGPWLHPTVTQRTQKWKLPPIKSLGRFVPHSPSSPLSPSSHQAEITLTESKHMEQGMVPELLYLILITPWGIPMFWSSKQFWDVLKDTQPVVTCIVSDCFTSSKLHCPKCLFLYYLVN